MLESTVYRKVNVQVQLNFQYVFTQTFNLGYLKKKKKRQLKKKGIFTSHRHHEEICISKLPE